ncbi:tigger transposable element-derived protein 1-like [Homarus americanus]|uniref:tigger transposable element-derived protein 1-like n=1 Tax=Homarus americanus TaxID=6706 RepID=UPI001C47F09A|nr:tigger transposable element-derived protein 1-like [Homarus americanus]
MASHPQFGNLWCSGSSVDSGMVLVWTAAHSVTDDVVTSIGSELLLKDKPRYFHNPERNLGYLLRTETPYELQDCIRHLSIPNLINHDIKTCHPPNSLKSNGHEEEGAKPFLANKGWFERFKRRLNLHNINMTGEAASADTDSAHKYPAELKKIIDEGGYTPEQVYNVVETGLFWKRMPARTFISIEEKSAPGFKASKDHLTLLVGGNASERYNARRNISNKALLLLDNAPSHPVNLNDLSDNVRVEYIPKNTTSLLQPMDQGVIANFKEYYLRTTFLQLIKSIDGEDKPTIRDFWKKFNILNAVDNIAESWDEVKTSAMNGSWKSIWPECVHEFKGFSQAESLQQVQ